MCVYYSVVCACSVCTSWSDSRTFSVCIYIVCVCKFNEFLVTCKSDGELVGLPQLSTSIIHCRER